MKNYKRKITLKESAPKKCFLITYTEGLDSFVRKELKKCFPSAVLSKRELPSFYLVGDISYKDLSKLKTASSTFEVLNFKVPRPKSLLSENYLGKISSSIKRILSKDKFTALRIEAAGKDTSIINDIALQLSKSCNLPYSPEEGDLVIRIRPSPQPPSSKNSHKKSRTEEWEVLIRTTPRPLSVRDWRKVDYVGALNSTIAHSILLSLSITKEDKIINPMCGSGTFLAELQSSFSFKEALGVDTSKEAISAALNNCKVSSHNNKVVIKEEDALKISVKDNSYTVGIIDLPWGERLGNRSNNKILYPKALKELFRVVSKDGRIAIITQDMESFEYALSELPQKSFEFFEQRKVYQGGFYPTITLLKKIK